jgi:hypothetical protein
MNTNGHEIEAGNAEPIETVAGELYEEYCRAVGGRNFRGEPLPGWPEFAADPNKLKQAEGWRAVAARALALGQWHAAGLQIAAREMEGKRP